MKLWNTACAAVVLGGAGMTFAAPDAAKDDLRKNLKDGELVGSWVYDDLGAGFAEARKAGKPLLVVFR